MGWRRSSLAAGLAVMCALATGCIDGTTPDCSGSQCLVLSVVEGGADGGDGAATDGQSDAEGLTDAMGDATVPGEAGPVSSTVPDAGPSPGDASHITDGGDSG